MKSCSLSVDSASSDLMCAFEDFYLIRDLFIYFQIAAEREKEQQKQEEERQQASITLKKAKEEQAPKTFKEGVGKYINPATM